MAVLTQFSFVKSWKQTKNDFSGRIKSESLIKIPLKWIRFYLGGPQND